MRDLSKILKGYNFLHILSKQRCLWQINETLAHQDARWVGGKEKMHPLRVEASFVDIFQCQN
jgi:hypothetical protein